MKLRIDSVTAYSAVMLFIVSTAFIFGIMRYVEPDIVRKTDRSFCVWKSLLYSSLISALFTIFITIVSLEVDRQYARKRKMIAKLNATT